MSSPAIRFDFKRFGLLLALAFIFFVFAIPCPLKIVFSIPCPTCGITTAYKALLNFDISGAFRANGIFYLAPLILFVSSIKKGPLWRDVILIAMAFVIFIYGCMRIMMTLS